jgi:hypothetical protein
MVEFRISPLIRSKLVLAMKRVPDSCSGHVLEDIERNREREASSR